MLPLGLLLRQTRFRTCRRVTQLDRSEVSGRGGARVVGAGSSVLKRFYHIAGTGITVNTLHGWLAGLAGFTEKKVLAPAAKNSLWELSIAIIGTAKF